MSFPMTITEQIESYDTTDIQAFELTDSNNQVIISGGHVTDYFDTMYGDFKILRDLKKLWLNYLSLYYNDWLKIYEAYNKTYNPIENYNSTETNVFEVMDGMTTNTVTHGKTTTITANSIKLANNVTTFDSATPIEANDNTQTGNSTESDTGTTTTTTDQGVKSLTVGDTTYTADRVNAEIKKRSGNIGVMSTQTMLTQERDLRMLPPVELLLDKFIAKYAYHT